jgi:aconitase B
MTLLLLLLLLFLMPDIAAGLIQVDAAIENPTRTEPTHLLLRSNKPSQTVTLSLTNAGVSYPITYRLGHQPAAAVSLKDTWFTMNAEKLLQPLGASVSFAVAGKAVGEVVVQPGQKVEVQVRG